MDNERIELEDQYQTNDLILAAYLLIRGFKPAITREGVLGVFSFPESAREAVSDYYDNDGRFKEFHNTVRDLKQQVKSL